MTSDNFLDAVIGGVMINSDGRRAGILFILPDTAGPV